MTHVIEYNWKVFGLLSSSSFLFSDDMSSGLLQVFVKLGNLQMIVS